jgi:hypothetical protein
MYFYCTVCIAHTQNYREKNDESSSELRKTTRSFSFPFLPESVESRQKTKLLHNRRTLHA